MCFCLSYLHQPLFVIFWITFLLIHLFLHFRFSPHPINPFPPLFFHCKLTTPDILINPPPFFLTFNYIFCTLITNMGGGNNKQKKSSSFFSFFKPRRSRTYDEHGFEDGMSARNKIFPSDEDKVRWIADPRIDTKASAFIAHFHATRVSESEVQYCSAGKVWWSPCVGLICSFWSWECVWCLYY